MLRGIVALFANCLLISACETVPMDFSHSVEEPRAAVVFQNPAGTIRLREVDLVEARFTGRDAFIGRGATQLEVSVQLNNGRPYRGLSGYSVEIVPPGVYLVSQDAWTIDNVVYYTDYTRCFEAYAAVISIERGVVNLLERPELLADRANARLESAAHFLAQLEGDAERILAQYPGIEGTRVPAQVVAIASVNGSRGENCGSGNELSILWRSDSGEAPPARTPK